jgi:hypothetical protein
MPQFHQSLPPAGGQAQSSAPGSARGTSHPQMAHNVALVLGGGGAAGNAWQIGIIAGLAEAGLDLSEAADLVVGTSAGATAAADLQRAMGAFGLESDSILGPGAAQRRAMVAARLPRHEWPDRPMIVVALDAHTSELAAFDRDSGVDLVDAVTASTALPGLVPRTASTALATSTVACAPTKTPTSPRVPRRHGHEPGQAGGTLDGQPAKRSGTGQRLGAGPGFPAMKVSCIRRTPPFNGA